MKGQLQKLIEASSLACRSCRFFKDHDPDIFYCEWQQAEFPALCEQYQHSKHIAPMRTEWGTPDERV